MKKIILLLLVLFLYGGQAGRSETLCPQALSQIPCEYSEYEMRILVRCLVRCSIDNKLPLQEKIDKLDPFEKLLLHAWKNGDLKKDRLWDGGVNASLIVTNLDYDAYRDSLRQVFSRSILHVDEKKEQRQQYWDKQATLALQVIEDHITKGAYSERFIVDILSTVPWFAQSKDGKITAKSKLSELMGIAAVVKIRRALFGALSLLPEAQGELQQRYWSDADPWIAHKSLQYLVEQGNARVLPQFVRTSWLLYGGNTTTTDLSGFPVTEINLQHLLEILIPESGLLFSESSQLLWLEKNLPRLEWDGDKKVFYLKKQGKGSTP